MKKKIVALAALSAIAGAAQAQSSVTLYGIVDVAVRYTTNQGPASDNGQSLTSVIGGGMSQSRWGINVNEDLGGGLRALANLESRFTSDDGANRNLGGGSWNQSWVGLQSTSFGRLTAGRQYNVLFDVTTGNFATFKYSPYIEAYKPEVAVALGARNDNMVKYALTLGGFTGELQVSAGEGSPIGATNLIAGKSYGGMAAYKFSGFAVGAGYLEREDVTGLKADGWVLGGSWTSGPIYVSGGYAQNNFDKGIPAGLFLIGSGADNVFSYTAPGAAINVETRTLWFLNGQYQLTPAINIGAAYWNIEDEFYSPVSAAGKPSGDFFALIAQYAFSKRTDAYVGLDYTDISGPISFRQNGTAVPTPNGATDRTGFMVGLRHRF